ncbi:MAG: hypothetical protein KC468_24890 [Myxococcales bacterium]|nr:hypothetical protein [Myxococcales bacterium]
MLAAGLALVSAALASAPAQPRAADEAVLEFHFTPAENLQIAIWIEDADGEFVQDVFVTQAVGKFGIGNRPGRWDFLSSWRFPYGPRPSALPIWAGRRGASYPRVVWWDSIPEHQDSLGWHEATSSTEPYFCVPLTPDANEVVTLDTMTCPSPSSFRSDKGRFAPGEQSPYPPRNDLMKFEVDTGFDSPDAPTFSDVNDLDSVTSATPSGDAPQTMVATVPAAVLDRGPITAWIEVSREGDMNEHWTFTRHQHFVDPKLAGYGVEYLGQPSVVFRVELEARVAGFAGAREHFGYGDWDGATSAIHPPDGTLSASGGSGVDRLREFTMEGERVRFGVVSHGLDGAEFCADGPLEPIPALLAQSTAFDTVELLFTVPPPDPARGPLGELARARLFHLKTLEPLAVEMLGAATEATVTQDAITPGEPTRLLVDQLWGGFTYQFGVLYEDKCGNQSPLTTASLTTPRQEFQQIEGACFLATASYGASWRPEVSALRALRDLVLRRDALGQTLIQLYYAHSPPLADLIRAQPLLRSMTRAVIQPVADVSRLATRSASP